MLNPSQKGRKILVVDDESKILQFISMGLTMEGYEVIAIQDSLQSVDTAKQQMPDLVILDVKMPGLDGWEVLRLLRLMPETKSTPVLMLTAHGLVKDVDKAMELGANDYLVKPFELTRLLKKIAALLCPI